MADLSVVMDKLHGFETADDLAEFFRGYGIKAKPRNSMSCAISQFVKEETGLSDVETGMKSVTIYKNHSGEIVDCIVNTIAMRDFVDSYDRGGYSDLVEEGCKVAYSPPGSPWNSFDI